MNPSRHPAVALLLALALLVAACGDDDAGEAATTSTTSTADTAETTEATTTTEAVVPLTILVTNDDGIGAPGIDALVAALSGLDDVEVVIVAPATNKSASSDKTTSGAVDSAPGATASGTEGTAVDGFPADAVNVALGALGIEPHLVVSGVNEGQNVGPLAALSGTVGAARTAIRNGVPAVAASAGFEELADYDAAAALVVEWIVENRAAIADSSIGAEHVVSFNVPGCTAGDVGALVEVPLATELPDPVFEADCSVEAGDEPPVDDASAIARGFAAETLVPADL